MKKTLIALTVIAISIPSIITGINAFHFYQSSKTLDKIEGNMTLAVDTLQRVSERMDEMTDQLITTNTKLAELSK